MVTAATARPFVLVVDDETPLHAIYQRIVVDVGAEPAIAASCAEAEAFLAGGQFACALLDKNLPDGNGIALAEHIGRRSPQTAIVLITGFASHDSVQEAIAAGVFDYIVKPFDISLLRQTLAAALSWAAGGGPRRRPNLPGRSPL